MRPDTSFELENLPRASPGFFPGGAPASLPGSLVERLVVRGTLPSTFAYDVTFGAGVRFEFLELLHQRGLKRCFGIMDEALVSKGGAAFLDFLDHHQIRCHVQYLPACETTTKKLETAGGVLEAWLAQNMERSDLVFGLGGGVIGDLTGFCASMALRGVGFVQIPTTLLAQVDSSVGGKTAVNTPLGKNLIGTFHQPVAVLCDTDFLQTLPPREIRAGFVELVKHALLADAAFFDWLEAQGPALLADTPARQTALRRSCAIKAQLVEADATECDRRALLNLGHSFGHALELLALHARVSLRHGEAVAMGLVLAFRFSVRLGLCSEEALKRVVAFFEALHIPTRWEDLGLVPEAHAMKTAMARDKKNQQGVIRLVLVRRIGEAFLCADYPPLELDHFLAEAFPPRPLSGPAPEAPRAGDGA